MPLVNCIVLESMRLYPPVPVVMRVAARDVVLQPARTSMGLQGEQAGQPTVQGDDWTGRALHVRAGTLVTIPIATLHRDERYWGPDPDAFNPLRFERGIAGAALHPMAYIPFSHGPRNCVGAQFALLEARVILAVLLQHLDWRLSPGYMHKPTMILTLRPTSGLQLLVRRAM